MVARAMDFTAFVALNFFFFFRVAILRRFPSRTQALCNNRVLP